MAMGLISLVYNSQLGRYGGDTAISVYAVVATTFFQSIAKPVPSIVITLLRQILFLIPFIYLFPVFWDINGIFMAQPVSDAFALIDVV